MSFDSLLSHLDFALGGAEPPPFFAAHKPPPPPPNVARPVALFKGLPPFSDEDWTAIREEAALYRGRAERSNNHMIVEAGPFSRALQRTDRLLEFMRPHVPDSIRFEPTTTFLHWYDGVTDFIPEHRDRDDFFLGFISLVSHEYQRAPSCLFHVHPVGGEPYVVPLEPGESVMLFGGAVTHSRTRASVGEVANTLTMGFRLLPCDDTDR